MNWVNMHEIYETLWDPI